MTTGLAFKMRKELAELAQRYGTPAPVLQLIPALPECDELSTISSGWASTPAVDFERTRFSLGSLRWDSSALPPLQFRHQDEPVGRIIFLRWTSTGLAISAETSHPQAMVAGGFSITATIKAYSIVPGANFHAVVTDAWLNSVSLTDRPCNAECVVEERMPGIKIYTQWYDLMRRRIEILQQIAQLTMPIGATHGH